MYEALARTILLEDDPRVVRDVERVRARHPRFSDAEIVRRVTGRTAWRCAAVGALASAGGQIFGALASTADLSLQALSLNRLAQAIALARHRPTTVVERGLGAASSLAVAGATAMLRRASGHAIRRALRRQPDLAPIVSALVGGTVAYVSARLLGRAVEEFLAKQPRRRR